MGILNLKAVFPSNPTSFPNMTVCQSNYHAIVEILFKFSKISLFGLARKHKNSSIRLLLAKRVLVTGKKEHSEIRNQNGVLATSYSL